MTLVSKKVYGAVDRKGEQYYTYLKKLFDAIGNRQVEYNWLITDCVCYPKDPLYRIKVNEEELYEMSVL